MVTGLLAIIRPFLFPDTNYTTIQSAEAAIPQPTPISQPVRTKKISNDEIMCMAKNIFYEARGTSDNEKIRVINVTMNRLESKKYPDTVCGVVHQYKQFSWTLEEKKVKTPVELLYAWDEQEMNEWEQAKKLAERAITKGIPDITKGAMYYHTHAVSPSWASKKIVTVESKYHKYYQSKR